MLSQRLCSGYDAQVLRMISYDVCSAQSRGGTQSIDPHDVAYSLVFLEAPGLQIRKLTERYDVGVRHQ